jgi:hypothetical protein
MKRELRHWGNVWVGALSQHPRLTLRNIIDSELSETRVFSDRLYREFSKTSRRGATARILRERQNLPWPPVGYAR